MAWREVEGGVGEMKSTSGYALKVEPTEFADRLDVGSPYSAISLELLPRSTKILEIPPPSYFCSDDGCSTLHHWHF